MTDILIFDLDGTLTPQKGVMDTDIAQRFLDLTKSRTKFLVTGSTSDRVIEQLPASVLLEFPVVFTHSGNEMWCRGQLQYKNYNVFSPELWSVLEEINELVIDNYEPCVSGCTAIDGDSTVTLLLVGENPSVELREQFIKLDKELGIRDQIIGELSGCDQLSNYEFFSGGDTSIDIMPRGLDKRQILNHINYKDGDRIIFIGDKINVNYGNDAPLVKAIQQLTDNYIIFETTGPDNTLEFLSTISTEAVC